MVLCSVMYIVKPFGSAKTALGSSSVLLGFLGLYSIMFPVAGSILAILLEPASASHMLPNLSEVIPAGLAADIGIL